MITKESIRRFQRVFDIDWWIETMFSLRPGMMWVTPVSYALAFLIVVISAVVNNPPATVEMFFLGLFGTFAVAVVIQQIVYRIADVLKFIWDRIPETAEEAEKPKRKGQPTQDESDPMDIWELLDQGYDPDYEDPNYLN